VPGASGDERIPNYLVHAILVTLFCCVPFGIPAIIYAAQVDGKAASGDYYGAEQASRRAGFWCTLGFGVGLVVTILSVLFSLARASQFAPG
jgi:hypothetical protein